jgi:hypothetical protein
VRLSVYTLRRELPWAQALASYRQLLTYIKTAVTRNYSEKSINAILDTISAATDTAFLEAFYATTLQALEESQNEVRPPSVAERPSQSAT